MFPYFSQWQTVKIPKVAALTWRFSNYFAKLLVENLEEIKWDIEYVAKTIYI